MLLDKNQQEHLEKIISKYKGDGEVLRNALGSLMIGRLYGYKVLRVMNSDVSYAKYQRVLDLRFNEWCPSETDLTKRHRGYKIANATNKFWKIIKGDVPKPSKLKEARKVFG